MKIIGYPNLFFTGYHDRLFNYRSSQAAKKLPKGLRNSVPKLVAGSLRMLIKEARFDLFALACFIKPLIDFQYPFDPYGRSALTLHSKAREIRFA